MGRIITRITFTGLFFILILSGCSELNIKSFIDEEINQQAVELLNQLEGKDSIPQVISSDPLFTSVENGIAVDAAVSVIFSDYLNADSLTSETVRLLINNTPVSGTITYIDVQKKVIFTPDTDLDFSTTYTVYLSRNIKNAFGNRMAGDFAWQFVTLNQGGPVNGSITINGAEGLANYTGTNTVSLTLHAEDDKFVESMRIAYSPVYVNEGWELYATTINSWALDGTADGLKILYVWFKDGDGNISGRYSATIILDRGKPDNISIKINNGATYTNSTAVSIYPAASDIAGTGQLLIRLSSSSTYSNNGWVKFAIPVAWNLSSANGTQTVYAWFKDPVGNVSAIYCYDTIILDTTAPAISAVSPDSGATGVSVSASVSVRFSENIYSKTLFNDSSAIENFYVIVKPSGLKPEKTVYVSGTVSYNSVTYTATFIPDRPLSQLTTYRAIINSNVKDPAGNALTAYQWDFTTYGIIKLP